MVYLLFTSRDNFCGKIGSVLFTRNISALPFIPGCTLMDKMVRNRFWLLSSLTIRGTWIHEHWFIVTKNVSAIITSDSHHCKFILEAPDILCALLHSNKLWTERQSFYTGLLFTEPVHGSLSWNNKWPGLLHGQSLPKHS